MVVIYVSLAGANSSSGVLCASIVSPEYDADSIESRNTLTCIRFNCCLRATGLRRSKLESLTQADTTPYRGPATGLE